MSESAGLYLHIPFCRHRCSYCDFNTYTSLGDLKQLYTHAMCREISQVSAGRRLKARTIYFGGGTPSLMPPEDLEMIMQALDAGFDLSAGTEVTMEANPETVNGEYLASVRSLGFNRISLGAQSAAPDELALLERKHTYETVVRAVEEARSAGFDNINLDLIYGLPNQDLESWERSLLSALDMKPEHLSLYCLIIEEGTPMRRWVSSGRIREPDPDLAADQYELARELLRSHGYEHYEISNWAQKGRPCQHNLIYWRNQTYLGLGAGAHGHAKGYRYHVVKQPRVYIRRMEKGRQADFPCSSAVSAWHRLERRERMSDTIITQLRLVKEGLDVEAFERNFDCSLQEAYPGVTERLVSWDLLCEKGNRLILTEKGLFLSNQVFIRYL